MIEIVLIITIGVAWLASRILDALENRWDRDRPKR